MAGQLQYRIIEGAELRADIENRQISGYGIVFNSDSLPLTIIDGTHGNIRVIEQITAQSMREADMSDVISAYNHNFEKILGRTSSNTMTLSTDENGVKYTVRAGSQSYANDLIESLRRGDVVGSSFTFTYDHQEGYSIEEREDGTIIAIPKKITKIYEMGPVTNPAYPETTAENRSGELEKAVKRHLDAKAKQEANAAEESQEDEEESRAMDVMEMANAVESAFYREFDFKEEYDNAYYYVKSIMVDNTLVAKELPSRKLYQVSFSINEEMEVSFESRADWQQVQIEFTPVRFWEEKEAEKRAKDEEGDLESRTDSTFYPKVYFEYKAIAKRRV